MAPTLRILHILRAPIGGLFRHVRDLALEQVKWGLQVGVLVDANSCDRLTQQRLASLESKLPLGLHKISMGRAPGLSDLKCIAQTRNLARELNIDVLHGHGAKGGLYARLGGSFPVAADRPRPLRFYTPHGGSLHYFDGSIKGNVYVTAEAALLRATDGLIFESAFARDKFASSISLEGVPHRVIHNGVSDSDFTPRVLEDDAAEFLFLGELRHLKGVDLLLEALAQLDHGSPRVVIVGDGPDAQEFRQLSHRLGLGARVTFTGALPAREAFTKGKILIMPSRAESFPYVLLEAAAAGIPFIATSVGGVPEMVEGTGNRLVPPGDAQALACAMAMAVDDFGTAQDRAVEMREIASKRFTTEQMMKSVLEFYRDGLLRCRAKTPVSGAHPGGVYYNGNKS